MASPALRSVRRHHRARMVAKAVRLFRMFDGDKNTERDARGLSAKRRPHDAERLADNLAACSCLFCRNPHDEKWLRRKERAA